jgi:hypothetical protein
MAVDDVFALYNFQVKPVCFGKVQTQQITDRLTQLKNIHKIFHTGLHTGHHAEVFLQHSKDLKWYVSCDGLIEAHTEKVSHYLSQLFPDRFCFLKGHSKVVIPLHAKVIEEIKFDLIFVDGHKECDELVSEIIQSKLIAHEKTQVWINNYHDEKVKKACDILTAMQQIAITKCHQDNNEEQTLAWIEARFI